RIRTAEARRKVVEHGRDSGQHVSEALSKLAAGRQNVMLSVAPARRPPWVGKKFAIKQPEVAYLCGQRPEFLGRNSLQRGDCANVLKDGVDMGTQAGMDWFS